ncbi:LAME_0B01156g1_1 [Lachancea meyersii CBS 8951]|uniref:LAME_0B01156g1_1 n=1 Tax=Lachancea meyersii CBS 8951 TaxID=1266667 RepID=A0A1G4ISS6_9SACH|nr:LAME_0B01156g1_1 [Lachancea meyersii CBS 8951]
MLSSSFRFKNALCIRSRVAACWNTTAANAARQVHPISQLSLDLGNQLKVEHNTLAAFNLFKKEVYDVSQNLNDPRFTLQRSFGLNSVLKQLLQASKADLTSSKGSADSNAQLPPNPYEILTVMCQHGLARDLHFQVVFEHLVASNAPQDILGLWVKYLETLTENPRAITYGSHHENNLALASIGYLMLRDKAPHLSELAQILNIGDTPEKIQMSRLRYLIDTLQMDPAVRKIAKNSYSLLLLDFVRTCRPEFEKQLKGLDLVQDVQSLFQNLSTASRLSEQPLSGDIIAAFMIKFTQLKKPQQAIQCFNLIKQTGKVDLSTQNALLVAVANIPVFGRDVREQKAKRIEAVWNTYFTNSSDPIETSSYIALVRALGESRNFQQLQQLWINEIPSALKAEQKLTEEYLLFQSFRKNFSLEGIKGQLPEKIGSLELANQVLRKMTEERLPEAEIDQFYKQQFTDPDAPLKPDSTTLALKMYFNSLYTKDPEFQFFKSISKSKNDVGTSTEIFKKFTEICPEIDTVRSVFKEIETPLGAKKYGYMITAESKAGNIDACEEVFKKFVKETRDMNTITRSILDPIIEAVCEQSIKEKSTALLEKMLVYATFAKKAQKSLTYQAASKVTHTLAQVSKALSGKFTSSEADTIAKLLQDVYAVRNFTPSQRNVDILVQNKVALPKASK